MTTEQLIEKYNIPGPRYTSYPSVPHWDDKNFTKDQWFSSLEKQFSKDENQGISLYIHLPFCESLCTFCGCHKHITKQHSVEEPYIQAVLKEWELYLVHLPNRPIVQEIHLGGGTPTFFSPIHLQRLLTRILDSVEKSSTIELSFEGHPNNTSKEHLETLFSLDFKRVSFGIQDYNPKIQELINRTQSETQVQKVHQLAKAIGFTSISHDLVYGLPQQKIADISNSIQKTILLQPDRISLYSYAHVPWIKGLGQRKFSEIDLPNPQEKREMYEEAKTLLIQANYLEVGMDHFALASDDLSRALLEKRLHRNFMGYTTNQTTIQIGLGMSAISDCWGAFAQNVKSVKEYLSQISQNQLPMLKGHTLSLQEKITRKHILQLMCAFETSWCESFEQSSYFKIVKKKLQPLINDKLVRLEKSHLFITEKGKAFIRNICMCFDPNFHSNETIPQQFSKTI